MSNQNIKLAKFAGFCYGVKRAVETAKKLKQENPEKNFFPASQEYLFLLQSKRESDKILETTLSGPHRDRINFVLNKELFIPTASTGQCRLISLILRVAQKR